ncbi:copper chaperone PCu(A)C [Corynebacterium choanae]|uniref:Copper chaperone PCu(A)C n=1 Tax=Corynebacterium choanae TaxID=1862358 RepID=A0A3G6J6M1_9CORY|nr:copper chaperone PCu(A)C [Corynebacterium choanae]AZA13717.1 hypothetical protein CCHOA_06590 [Corynebacterium choanae]
MRISAVKITAAAAVASALVLSACGSDDSAADMTVTSVATETDTTTTTPSTTTSTSTSTSTTTEAAAEKLNSDNVQLKDAYFKAAVKDDGHTALFGVFENDTDQPLNIVGFTSTIDAGMNQLHEVVNGVMKEKEGGFVVEPGQDYELKPGADHMMVMKLNQDVKAGDTFDVTVEFADGQTVEYTNIPVREIASGAENYGDDSHADHAGHEGHEGHDHDKEAH